MRLYRAWCPGDGKKSWDGREFRARTADHAAEQWAEMDDSDSAEYQIIGGKEKVVFVCRQTEFAMACRENADNPEPPVQIFKVYGESIPEYTATEVKS